DEALLTDDPGTHPHRWVSQYGGQTVMVSVPGGGGDPGDGNLPCRGGSWVSYCFTLPAAMAAQLPRIEGQSLLKNCNTACGVEAPEPPAAVNAAHATFSIDGVDDTEDVSFPVSFGHTYGVRVACASAGKITF